MILTPPPSTPLRYFVSEYGQVAGCPGAQCAANMAAILTMHYTSYSLYPL
jgi:hypothetical protein